MFKSVSVIDYSIESIVLSTSPYNRLTLSIDCMFDFAIWQFQFMQMPLVGFLSFCAVYMYECMHLLPRKTFSLSPLLSLVQIERERERERESYSRKRECVVFLCIPTHTLSYTHTPLTYDQ